MAAKITKVELVKARRKRWPCWKVREITEGGRVAHSWEHDRASEARAAGKRIAREHGAQFVEE